VSACYRFTIPVSRDLPTTCEFEVAVVREAGEDVLRISSRCLQFGQASDHGTMIEQSFVIIPLDLRTVMIAALQGLSTEKR
jgi:hypothetical protein